MKKTTREVTETIQKVRILADLIDAVNRTQAASSPFLLCFLIFGLTTGCSSRSPSRPKNVTSTQNLLLDPGTFTGQHQRTLTFINNVDRFSLTIPTNGAVECSQPVWLGENPRLFVGVGILRPVWKELTAPITLEIQARESPGEKPWTTIYRRSLNPNKVSGERRWLDEKIDLTPLAGETVGFRFLSHSALAPSGHPYPVAFSNPSVRFEIPRPERGDVVSMSRVVLDLVEGRVEGVRGRPDGIPRAVEVTSAPDGQPESPGLVAVPANPGSTLSVRLRLRGDARLEVSGAVLSPLESEYPPARARFLVDLLSESGTRERLVDETVALDRHELFQRSVDIPSPTPGGKDRQVTLELRVEAADGSGAGEIEIDPSGPTISGWTEVRLRDSFSESRRRQAKHSPNVLILLVDTLRADHLSCYGYPRPTSPKLDAFAKRSLRFEFCIANASWTLPSVASLFTGAPPPAHGVTRIETARLSSGYLTLAEVFQDAGYATSAFVANGLVSAATQFDQGFSHFESHPSRRAATINESFLFWLDRIDENEAYFSYLHFLDPHGPYSAPAPFRNRFVPADYKGALTNEFLDLARLSFQTAKQKDRSIEARQNYIRKYEKTAVEESQNFLDRFDEEIASLDHEIGRLLDELEGRGRLKNTIVVFTSDHGEAFFEHGKRGHGKDLYGETLHIPLLICYPGKIDPGVSSAPVQLTSILPTLARLADLPIPETASDPPLPLSPTDFSLSTLYSSIDSGRAGGKRKIPMQSIRTREYKLIESETEPVSFELYHLLDDPAEQNDLYPGQDPALIDSLSEMLREWKEAGDRERTVSSATAEDFRRLAEGMGYAVPKKKKKQQQQH